MDAKKKNHSLRQAIPCPTWLSWLVEIDNPLFKNHQASQIILHAGVQSGSNALDFGCGPGRLTIPLARAVGPDGRVTALDIQPGMLEKARRKASQAGLSNIEFVLGAAGAGLLKQEQYERAFLVTVLGEIPDQAAALRELYGCLKPGGLLSITEIIMDPHFQRGAKVRELATRAGFTEEESFGSSASYTANYRK